MLEYMYPSFAFCELPQAFRTKSWADRYLGNILYVSKKLCQFILAEDFVFNFFHNGMSDLNPKVHKWQLQVGAGYPKTFESPFPFYIFLYRSISLNISLNVHGKIKQHIESIVERQLCIFMQNWWLVMGGRITNSREHRC